MGLYIVSYLPFPLQHHSLPSARLFAYHANPRPTVFLTTIPSIFQVTYHQSPGIAGLHYLALGVGLSGASQVNARMLDKVYGWFKDRNGGVGKPEFRLRECLIAFCFGFGFGLMVLWWSW